MGNHESQRKWRQANAEYLREKRKKNYQLNKEKEQARARQYASEHREQRAAYQKKWCLENREYRAAWLAGEPDKKKQYAVSSREYARMLRNKTLKSYGIPEACPYCTNPLDDKNLPCWDHDKELEAAKLPKELWFRDWLCRKCNASFNRQMADNPEIILRMYHGAVKHKARREALLAEHIK